MTVAEVNNCNLEKTQTNAHSRNLCFRKKILQEGGVAPLLAFYPHVCFEEMRISEKQA